MGRKPTAADVAREAGVSPATVDRVLNSRGGVSKDKESRVLRAARRIGLDRALNLREARTLRVAVLIQPPRNPFHAQLSAAVAAENAGPDPFNIALRVMHIDPARPDRIAARIREAAAGHDALIVCAAHDARIADALGAAAGAGRVVVTLATAIDLPAPHIYVGPDNRRSGRIAGDLMGRFLAPGGGEIVVITGLGMMTGQAERAAGFAEVLAARYPACHVVQVAESREDPIRAGEIAAVALRRFPGLRGIYNASAGAEPVAAAIAAAKRPARIAFVTHELTPERRALLRAGRIDAIIDQEPALEVRRAIEAIAARFGRLEPGPRDTVTPVRIHTIETC